MNVTQYTDLDLECMSVVKPYRVIWSYSADNGETWQELETSSKNTLRYKIREITEENDGESRENKLISHDINKVYIKP